MKKALLLLFFLTSLTSLAGSGTLYLKNNHKFFCSATLIGAKSDTIITLGHCLGDKKKSFNLNDLRFTYGSRHLSDLRRDSQNKVRTAKIIGKWEMQTLPFCGGKKFSTVFQKERLGRCDIALLKLDRPIRVKNPKLSIYSSILPVGFRGMVKLYNGVTQFVYKTLKPYEETLEEKNTEFIAYKKPFKSAGSGGAIMQRGKIVGMHKYTLFNAQGKRGAYGASLIFDQDTIDQIHSALENLE